MRRLLLALIGLLAIVGAIAAAIFFFGGYYNVAATNEDPAIVKWALVTVREAAVRRYATEQPPAGFDSAAQVQAGARQYSQRGCVLCHGAPGVEWGKFSEAMRPYPPDLKEVVKQRTPGQLFWVIKNGINMTGMPGFALVGVEDKDLWSIVAFIRKLEIVSEADYKAWTAP
jgi:mono/diheme cytochrome c family protein